MKKLFALLLMLGGALSSWADGNSQLASNAFTDGSVVDLRENTSVTPATITQFVTSPATTVIFPSGWTAADVKTAGENLKNSSISFGTAVSTTNSSETNPVTRYYYTNDGGDRVYVANNWQNPIEVTFNETFSISDGTLELDRSYSAYINNITNQEVEVDLNDDNISDGYYYPDEIQNVQLTPYALDGNGNEVSGWNPFLNNNTNTYYCNTNSGQLEINAWKYQYNGNWITYPGVPVINEWGGISPVTIDNSDRSISFKVDTYYVYSYTSNNEPKTTTSTVELTEFSDSYNKQYYLTEEQVLVPTWTKLYAYVNTPGTLDNAIADATIFPNVTTQVTIFGNINNDDLSELSETNFRSVEYLSMKDAVLDGNITTINSKATAAIILPAIKDGTGTRNVNKMELGVIQAKSWQNNDVYGNWNNQVYRCLSYFDKDNATKMYIYAFDATVAKLGSAVSNNTAITFIPKYKTDGDFAEFIGQSASSDDLEAFRVALGQLPAISMDLSIVHNKMYPDFRHLNANTHYLTVPGNVQNSNVYGEAYDFTCETETSVYKYPSTVWVVSAYRVDDADQYALDGNGNKIPRTDNNGNIITEDDGTPKYQRTGYGTYIHYAGKFLEATEPTNFIYVRSGVTGADGETVPSSLLAGAKNYFTNEQLYATRQIFIGSYNGAEIAEIDGQIHGNVFDFMTGTNFTTVTVGEGDAAKTLDCIVNLDNDNVKYILLPDNHEADINATSTDNCSFSNCSGLLCVGAYNTTTNTLTTWSSAPGNVYKVTSLIRPQKTNRGTGLMCASLENVVMSGALNWDDISANNQNGKDNGLEGATTIKSANMKFAYFPTNSDMVFSTAAWGSIEEITLPNNPKQTEIPALCLDNCKKLEATICIPYYYTKIGTNAFNNLPMTHVTATDAEGNVIDYGNKTITLPAKLELIQAGAFWTSDETISDVYILATKAPKCEANAFSAGGLYGWGGFGGNNTHPMCREVYWNNTKQFAMLHFPSDVTLDEAKKYTDVTRDYTLWDETGDYNGIGELRVWPNFSEIYRAYNQAVDGVTWDAWDLTRSKTNLNDIPCWPTSYKDASGATVNVENTYNAGVLIPASTTPATSAEANGYVYDTNYMGWHQFVLADYHRYKEIVIEEASTYTDGGWYTLCIPFDMTEDEVIRVMGVPASATYTGKGYEIASGKNAGCNLPIVYSLQKVTRQNPNIKLGFSQELMKQIELNSQNLVFNNNGTITLGADTYNNGKTSGSGKKVLIKGGYPYLVRPIFPEGFNEAANVNGNLGKYILSVCSFTDENIGNKKEGTDIAAPIISQKLIAVNQAGAQVTYEEDGKPYYYFFQGTYTPQRMPQAYYINNGSWWRQTTAGVRDWESFTAIIGGHTSVDGATYATASGANVEATNKKDFSTWFVMLNAYSDKFTTPGHNDVKFEITFEDEDGFDEVVAIDQINGESINSSIEGDVYNMAGQRVGTSVEGLSKGLYIVNGKKVLVK